MPRKYPVFMRKNTCRTLRDRTCGPLVELPGAHDSVVPVLRGPQHQRARRSRALVRLRESVHWRVKVPLWRCFPPRVESNCNPATSCGEQLETKGQSVELTGVVRPRHKLDTARCD